MFYYVKFTALSIKTICRALSLLVLKILTVYSKTSLSRQARGEGLAELAEIPT